MDGVCIGEGWEVIPEQAGLLQLRATSAGGAVAYGQVTVGSAPDVPEIGRMAVVVDDDLSIEARASLESREVESGVEIGEALRLDVDVEESRRVHFMVAGTEGTVLELDRHRGDFLAEEIIFNDTEVESRTDIEPGLYHLLILIQDLKGGNRWLWLDAPMGVDETWARSGERRLDLGEEVEAGLVAVTKTIFSVKLMLSAPPCLALISSIPAASSSSLKCENVDQKRFATISSHHSVPSVAG